MLWILMVVWLLVAALSDCTDFFKQIYYCVDVFLFIACDSLGNWGRGSYDSETNRVLIWVVVHLVWQFDVDMRLLTNLVCTQVVLDVD